MVSRRLKSIKISDTSLSMDSEQRLSIRAWREFFDLISKGLDKREAGYLIFGERADELMDAIFLSDDVKLEDLDKSEEEE